MSENEVVFRATVAALMIAGFAVRFHNQRQARHVRRVAARELGRDNFFYWLVFISYVLALVYAHSSLLDNAHIAVPDALRWLGAPFGLAGVALFAVAIARWGVTGQAFSRSQRDTR